MEKPEFDWDDGNVRHIARHAVKPVEAEEAILDTLAIMLEIQVEDNEEEERTKAIGRTSSGRILVTLFTFRGDAIRPITAYDATKRDQEVYLEGKLV